MDKPKDLGINAERQKTLISKWYAACRKGDLEQADRIWELFCEELKNG